MPILAAAATSYALVKLCNVAHPWRKGNRLSILLVLSSFLVNRGLVVSSVDIQIQDQPRIHTQLIVANGWLRPWLLWLFQDGGGAHHRGAPLPAHQISRA